MKHVSGFVVFLLVSVIFLKIAIALEASGFAPRMEWQFAAGCMSWSFYEAWMKHGTV